MKSSGLRIGLRCLSVLSVQARSDSGSSVQDIVTDVADRYPVDRGQQLRSVLDHGRKFADSPKELKEFPRVTEPVFRAQDERRWAAATRLCASPGHFTSKMRLDNSPPPAALEARQRASEAENKISCLKNDRDWLITDAHVVEGAQSLFVKSGSHTQPLKVERVDSLRELALLSMPKSSNPCASLPPWIHFPRSPDSDTAFNVPSSPVLLQYPDLSDDRVKSFAFESVLTSPIIDGLPGRDQAKLVMMTARGLAQGKHGYSGSPILARPDSVFGLTYRFMANPDYKLSGIITATDAHGRRIVGVSAEGILAFLQSYCTDLKDKKPMPDWQSTVVSGGTRYAGTNVVHYRNWIVPLSADFENSGPGDNSDGSVGVAHTGPGDNSDGSNNAPMAALPKTGLQIGSRRYVSWGMDWAEMESLPEKNLQQLRNGATPNGIYEENGRFYASSGQTPLQSWMLQSKYGSLWLMSLAGLRWKKDLPPGCELQVAMAQVGEKSVSQGVMAASCERQTPDGTEWYLTLLGPLKKSGPLTIKFALKRNCTTPNSGQPCPVEIEQKAFRASPRVNPKSYEPHGDLWDFIKSIDKMPSETFVVASPRLGLGKGSYAIVNYGGGYRIKLPMGTQSLELVGPSYERGDSGARAFDWPVSEEADSAPH